jgi:dihydrofolate reductase
MVRLPADIPSFEKATKNMGRERIRKTSSPSPATKRKVGPTKQRRKIIVYIATSADGYIARPDGGVDWLNRPRPKGNYQMVEFFRSIDTILWGRKTFPMDQPDGALAQSGPKIKNYVFTRNPPKSEIPGVTFVNEPIPEFAERLRAEPGKDIWMMGGAGIIASFLDAGEIDEFIIHIVPTFIGEGIPLVQPARRTVALELLSTRTFPDGVIRVHYRVKSQFSESPTT